MGYLLYASVQFFLGKTSVETRAKGASVVCSPCYALLRVLQLQHLSQALQRSSRQTPRCPCIDTSYVDTSTFTLVLVQSLGFSHALQLSSQQTPMSMQGYFNC